MKQVPAEAIGPKMAALRTDRQRAFCYLMGLGEESGAKAAREAGYPDQSDGAKVRASELLARRDILDAIEEVAGKYLARLAPQAIKAAERILQDRKHRAHARMIETVLDRTGFFARTEHKVTVEHRDDGRLLQFAARLALELGIEEMKLVGTKPAIEGDAVVSEQVDELPASDA